MASQDHRNPALYGGDRCAWDRLAARQNAPAALIDWPCLDTGRQRILIDTGFGEKLGPTFGSFPGLEANLRRAGITPESIDLVVMSHGHLDHIGGLVMKSGALAFPKAQFVFVDTEWNYWTGSRYESEVNKSSMPDPFKKGTIIAARENLPAVGGRSRFVKQAAKSQAACTTLLRRDIRRPMPQSCSLRARSSSSIWVTSPITR